MIRRLLLTILAGLALHGCGEPAPAGSQDAPFLWEVRSPQGEVEGWLYGTIHALPDGVQWRRGAIEDVISIADYLVLEVAAIDDSLAIARAFTRASRSPGHPPLPDRVAPEHREAISALAEEVGPALQDERQVESWAAAIILAQAIREDADSANGVDKALHRAFRDRPIEELEGAERQFAIFDALAEEDQREMLEAVAEQAQAQPPRSRAVAIWLAGDLAGLEEETRSGMLADPELREALLVGRNHDWAEQLVGHFSGQRRPLVAVGAAHLAGPDGLVALLEQRGYRLTRLR